MSDLVLIGAKVESAIKDWIAEFALRRRTSMSEVLRQAIIEYLSDHADSEEELAAAQAIRRKRMENVRLEIPKDRFDYFLFPNRVKDFVYKVKSEWESDGFLTKERYDHLVQLVEIEMDVIKGNPHEDLLTEMLKEIVTGLRKEQREFVEKISS